MNLIVQIRAAIEREENMPFLLTPEMHKHLSPQYN